MVRRCVVLALLFLASVTSTRLATGRTARSPDAGLLDIVTKSYNQLNTGLQSDLNYILAGLKRDRWTMLIGDSVLAQEFLALTKVLFAPTCTGQQFRWDILAERQEPAGFFLTAPIEYLLVCKRASNGTRVCEMNHEECLHLTPPEPCPSQRQDPFCGHVNHRLCGEAEWQSLVDRANAPGVELAVSYHWAPGPGLARKDPDIGDLVAADPDAFAGADVALLSQRFSRSKPGAVLMNNCLHTWPYSWSLSVPNWQKRLSLFQWTIQENLRALSAAGFQGRFAFMSCQPVECNERFAWKMWAPDPLTCKTQNDELQAVNVGVKRLFDGLGIGGSFVDVWHAAQGSFNTSIDGIHPCWTRPCEWEASAPQPTGAFAKKWSFWEDTDPSVCLAMSAQGWSGLAVSKGKGVHLPPAQQIATTALPRVDDLRADLFSGAAPPLVA